VHEAHRRIVATITAPDNEGKGKRLWYPRHLHLRIAVGVVAAKRITRDLQPLACNALSLSLSTFSLTVSLSLSLSAGTKNNYVRLALGEIPRARIFSEAPASPRSMQDLRHF